MGVTGVGLEPTTNGLTCEVRPHAESPENGWEHTVYRLPRRSQPSTLRRVESPGMTVHPGPEVVQSSTAPTASTIGGGRFPRPDRSTSELAHADVAAGEDAGGKQSRDVHVAVPGRRLRPSLNCRPRSG